MVLKWPKTSPFYIKISQYQPKLKAIFFSIFKKMFAYQNGLIGVYFDDVGKNFGAIS